MAPANVSCVLLVRIMFGGCSSQNGGASLFRFIFCRCNSEAVGVVGQEESMKNGGEHGQGGNNNGGNLPTTTEPKTLAKQMETGIEEMVANGRRNEKGIENGNWTEQEIMNWNPNDYEKDLVKLTWNDDFSFLYELGTAIYTYIFEHNPQAKVLFPKIHKHGDNWKQSAEFRSQALKFVQTISYAAQNIYHLEEVLKPRLFSIGQHHVKYAARGFKPEHWNIFLDAMESALIEHIHSIRTFTEQEYKDAKQVWRQLAHYIVVHMKQGYQFEEKKLTQKK